MGHNIFFFTLSIIYFIINSNKYKSALGIIHFIIKYTLQDIYIHIYIIITEDEINLATLNKII